VAALAATSVMADSARIRDSASAPQGFASSTFLAKPKLKRDTPSAHSGWRGVPPNSSKSMVLYRTTHLKVWLVLGIGIVLLHTLSFLYALSMALTIGAYGVVLMLAFLDVLAIIPLADLYLAKKR
jgi:hypothetical protein